MIHLRYPIYLLLAVIFFTACSDTDNEEKEEDMSEQECLLSDVYFKVDESTRVGLMSIEYDTNDKVSVAGSQDINFTYDVEGNVISALLEKGVGVPRVETIFTYTDGALTNASQVWGDDPLADPRYIYDLTYEGDFLDIVSVNGAFGSSTLDFDFDENGNVLTFVDWVFEDRTKFTYDTSQKGVFTSPLDHSKAIAYSIGTGREFWFWNNAISTLDDGDVYMFAKKYNDVGLLIEALSGEESYDFSIDYNCK